MSVYHIVFLLLLCGTLIEYYKKKTPKALFLLSFAILTCMLCFRFAQGTDYSAYRMIYYTMPTSFSQVLSYNYAKVEIGWRLLCMAFRLMNVDFVVFVFVLSILEMVLLWRFISRYCENGFFALFLSYHTLYFTYIFSALRQGTVIMIFLGILLQWLLDGKYIRYLICVALCTTIHSVAIVLFIPVVLQLIRLSVEHIITFVIIGMFAGIILSIFGVGNILSYFGMSYAGETNVSLFALVERVVSFVLVTYMYYVYVGGKAPEQDNQFFKLYKLYAFGIFLYGVLMWSPLISSRTIYVFKVLEIPLISTCVMKCRKSRMMVLVYCVLLCSVLYLKNISSSIVQGVYINTTVWNYPYFAVWDTEKVLDFRSSDAQYFEWLFKNEK